MERGCLKKGLQFFCFCFSFLFLLGTADAYDEIFTSSIEKPTRQLKPKPAKITNSLTGAGQADGIEPGGDRENSYAWSKGVLQHSDGEYLYVGSNRNLLYLVARIGGMSDQLIAEFFGGDVVPGTNYRARIFRYKLDGSKDWEIVYTSPEITTPQGNFPVDAGYRGMQFYAGKSGNDPAIYVVTFGQAAGYGRVLKFGNDFVPSGSPKEVFRIVGGNSLRAITAHTGKLCIGTFTNDIYCSENPLEQPSPPPLNKMDGWDKVASVADFGAVNASDALSGIWHFVSFNGYLYAFIGRGIDPQNPSSGGFQVYKGREVLAGESGANPYGWKWQMIVGDLSKGAKYPAGLGDPNNAAASPFIFKDQVYAGTFYDIAGLAAQGDFNYLFSNWTPPQIYRFDKNDKWEMVIGDTNTLFPTRIGNYGAGFYNPTFQQRLLLTPPYNTANLSLNGYVWWMEEYKGRLYASTFDMRLFLNYINEENLSKFGITDPERQKQIMAIIGMINTFNSNPPGFDLYSTSDGRRWTAVTLDGFGDRFNYGGRVLKATSNGLFIGTANPFYGAQVWQIK